MAKKQPYPYQQVAIDLGMRRNILLADQTGLGKTIVCLEIARQLQLLNQPHPSPVLVITPLAVMNHWLTSVQEAWPEIEILHSRAGRSSPQAAYTTTALGNSWSFFHYEALKPAVAAALGAVKWAAVIVDEAHRIKNRDAKRTLAVKMATRLAIRKIAATGTPWDKNPADLWSICNWLYPKQYTSYWSFFHKHVEVQNITYGPKTFQSIVGCKNQAALARELAPFTVARTKEQVAPELPPRLDYVLPIDLTPPQQRLYDQLRKSKELTVTFNLSGDEDLDVNEIELVILNHLSHMVKLLQLSTDPRLLNIPESKAPSGKLLWLYDYVADHSSEPLLIFTRYRNTAIALAQHFNEEADIIIGGTKSSDYVPGQAFLEGKRRILVGTIAAMREGLNLQRATTAIFVDQDWSSIMMSQAVDRIHRINITAPKQVIFLCSTPIDRLVYQAFTQKWTNATLVRKYLNLIHQEATHG